MRWMTVLLFICVIALALWRLVPDLTNHPFFVDEHEFLRKTYYFDLYFIRHDFKDPRWYDFSREGSVAQPKLGPYIYGLVFHALGYRDMEKTLRETGFNTITVRGIPWYRALWTKEPKTFPPELTQSMKLILIGRWVALFFTVGTIGLLFIFLSLLCSPYVAYVASIILVANPLFVQEGLYATTDTMQLFFFFSGLILLIFWQRAWVKKWIVRTFLLSVSLGVVGALATGVKVTGIMIILFALPYLVFVFLTGKMPRKRVGTLLINIFIILIVFFGLLWLLHPYLWGNPVGNFFSMFHDRLQDARIYESAQFPASAIVTRPQAVERIYERVLAPDASYGNFPLWGLPIDLALFGMGIVLLIRRPKIRMLPFWIGFIFLCLVLYLYNDWSRYYLPFVVCVCMTEGYAITWVIMKALKAGGLTTGPGNA